ncbi:hypothetical protein PsorP6_017125 [Peronosclerospora sorghi]|uniref:Uncharacterized protein n=1 Tax=Peronosclerospora sorghi TaxID=230839 RepID=A0ACC0WED6_9STRA|nr:hypothetical protein PsorP6_017125 [Peronosclerospora sorghi]
MPPTSSRICNVCGHDIDPRAFTFLIECHFCTRWFHGACVDTSERDALLVAKFACRDCMQEGHESVHYAPPPKGLLDVNPLSVSPLPLHLSTLTLDSRHNKTSATFRRLLTTAVYARSGVHSVASEDVPFSFLQHNTLDVPLLLTGNNHQLAGLDEPFPTLDAAFVAQLVTDNRRVVSTDVATQTTLQVTASTWPTILSDTVHDDANLVNNAEFQVHDTPIQTKVAPPLAVTHVDWRYILSPTPPSPGHDILGAFLEPHVYLDFLLAPGGQCTWLSVARGELWVYLIPPTHTNWLVYRQWKHEGETSATAFLAERVDKCIKCIVSAGSTVLVPSGWIYARYAGGVQCCSYFSGGFACTTVMDTQLGVMVLEAQITTAQCAFWRSVDMSVQVWTIVRYFLLLGHDTLSDDERRAVQRAVPRLREWSALPCSLQSTSGIGWIPRSHQEAHAIVNRLDQLLGDKVHPTLNLASPDNTHVAPLEASYMYSTADATTESAWPSSSATFDSMWTSYDALVVEQEALDVASMGFGPLSSSTVPPTAPGPVDLYVRHRASCHRCGNLRKHNLECPLCPHIFCAKCADKMYDEHGRRIFENGCPVCKQVCCCGKNRSTSCGRKFHCYKKCPSTKRPAAG